MGLRSVASNWRRACGRALSWGLRRGQAIPRRVTLVRLTDAEQGDDVELLDAWRGGDRTAGSRLVARHFAAVYRFIGRRVSDTTVARDLAQRTFVVLLETRDRLAADVRLRAWVIGIARNVVLRWFRENRRAPAAPAPEESIVSPSRVVAAREEQSLLRAALQTLPEELRTTLELHYWDELSTAEIGAVLGVAAGTVKWRLSRGRALLRERIAELAPTAAMCSSTLERLEHWARIAGAAGTDDPGTSR